MFFSVRIDAQYIYSEWMKNYPYFSSLLITLQISPSDTMLIYEEFSNKFSCCLLCAVDYPCLLPQSSCWRIQLCAVVFFLWQDPAVCPQGIVGDLCNFASSPLSQHLAIHGYEIFRAWDNILSLTSVNNRKVEFLTHKFYFVSLSPNLPLLGIIFVFLFQFQAMSLWLLIFGPFILWWPLAFCNSWAFSILSQMKSLIQQGQQDPENLNKILQNYKLKFWGWLNIRTIYMKMCLAVYWIWVFTWK